MEEEIDLRPYIETLIRRWRWIVGLALVAALAAAAVSFFVLSPTYEATALVLITNPRYQLNFDPRLETLSEIRTTSKVYPRLATSNDLLERVWAALDPPLEDVEHPLQALKEKFDASASDDPSLLELTVRDGEAAGAARLANTWAEQYVAYVNELYGRRDQDLAFFGAQLEKARASLAEAEEALIAFQARNQVSILNAQLGSVRQQQSEYLAEQRSIIRIVQDIQSLRAQLAGQPATRPASLADDLTVLFLQVKAFNAQSSMPLQFQVSSAESLSDETVAEQIAFLDELVENLENKSALLEERLATLTPEILRLQAAVKEIDVEGDRLSRKQAVARETYMTLASKVEEVRIAAQDETGEVQWVSRAAVPPAPSGPRKKLNVLIGGFLGLCLGVFMAFFVEYWPSLRALAADDSGERQHESG